MFLVLQVRDSDAGRRPERLRDGVSPQRSPSSHDAAVNILCVYPVNNETEMKLFV